MKIKQRRLWNMTFLGIKFDMQERSTTKTQSMASDTAKKAKKRRRLYFSTPVASGEDEFKKFPATYEKVIMPNVKHQSHHGGQSTSDLKKKVYFTFFLAFYFSKFKGGILFTAFCIFIVCCWFICLCWAGWTKSSICTSSKTLKHNFLKYFSPLNWLARNGEKLLHPFKVWLDGSEKSKFVRRNIPKFDLKN